jgi:hypothetical protein
VPHNHSDIPIVMERVYRRLEHWRRKRRGRSSPIPKPLWAAAAAVAREHGINRTSKVLNLEFNKLKELAGSTGARKRRKRPTPQFMELMTAAPAGFSECVIEFEERHGKVRIQWKGITASDVAELSRMLWEQA